MTKIFWSTLACFAIVGCSTNATKNSVANLNEPVLTPEAYAQWTSPFNAEKVSSRNPSSEVGKVTHVWEANSIKVTMKQNITYDQKVNVNFSQYAMYTTKEQRPVVVQKWVTVGWNQVSNPVLVCKGTATEGTGKAELWDKFYKVPKAQKAEALDKAIAGIGIPTAKNLIDANVFASKPRSWEEFSKVIRQARNQGVINETVEYQVLYKYRSDNMINLGYDTQVDSTCDMVNETYMQPVQQLRNVTEIQWQDIPHKELINQDTKTFRVLITGSRLQSFETEVLTITFHRELNKMVYSVEGDHYTNYVKTFNSGVIKLEGAGRKFLPLPQDAFAGGATLEASNGQAGFVATVNQKYIPKAVGEGKLLMTLEIRSCKRAMFGKKCALLGRNEKLMAKTVIAVGPDGVVRYPFVRDPNRYYFAKYWLNLAGSPWYTGAALKAPTEPGI